MNLLKLWIAAGLTVVACTAATEAPAPFEIPPQVVAAEPAAYLSYPLLADSVDAATASPSLSQSVSLSNAQLATPVPIRPQLLDRNAKDRAQIKSREIAKLATRGRFVAQVQYGVDVELGQVEEITGGVQVLARA